MCDKIKIDRELFYDFVWDQMFLNCLMSRGVHTWELYDKAFEDYESAKKFIADRTMDQ